MIKTTRLLFIAAALSFTSVACTADNTSADAQTKTQKLKPVSIYTKRVGGRNEIIGWTVSPKAPSYLRRHEPNDASLRGARLVLSNHYDVSLRGAVAEQLEVEGYKSPKFRATAPVTKIGIIDSRGKGSVFIGEAKMNGKPHKFAAASLYSNATGQRQTEVYVFIAPDETYVRLGGFVALLSANFQLDARKVDDLILRAGVSEPNVQAAYLANGVDGYYLYIGQLMNAFVQGSIAHTNQLLNQQCTGVSGTGPDAYGVTGLGNPDC